MQKTIRHRKVPLDLKRGNEMLLCFERDLLEPLLRLLWMLDFWESEVAVAWHSPNCNHTKPTRWLLCLYGAPEKNTKVERMRPGR